MARALRFRSGEGLNGAARLQENLRDIELGENAAREVLEHLALETIVIERMRGAARNVGPIIVVMPARNGAGFMVCSFIRLVTVLKGRLRDPGQWA